MPLDLQGKKLRSSSQRKTANEQVRFLQRHFRFVVSGLEVTVELEAAFLRIVVDILARSRRRQTPRGQPARVDLLEYGRRPPAMMVMIEAPDAVVLASAALHYLPTAGQR